MIRFLCLLLALAPVLSSCHAPTLSTTRIQIAKDATFDLLSPAALGQEVSLEQIVDARYGDQKFSFHCLLEVDAQQLVLVGMTPMNTRAFTLTLRGDQLTVEVAPGARLPAEPARILADLQLALWPELPTVHGLAVLLAGMDQYGRRMRLLQREGAVVIQVTYDIEATSGAPLTGDPNQRWSRVLRFEHAEQNYDLTVRTVRAEKLAP